MKKILLGMALMSTLVLTSCNEKAELAKQITGTWSGAPEVISNNANGDYTLINTYTFTVDQSGEGGDLIISTILSGNIPDNQTTFSLDQPVSKSLSGKATVNASWQAVDDDDIAVIIDPESLKIEVDPTEMVLTSNVITDNTSDTPENMTEKAVTDAQNAFRAVLMPYYTAITRIDDVEVKNGKVLTYEIGKKDYTMMKQAR